MSMNQHAFIEKGKVPNRDEWQASIQKLGFDFQLDSDLIKFQSSGFVPCQFEGKEGGFELYYQEAKEIYADFPELEKKVNSLNYAVTFRWGGDMLNLISVLIASLALMKDFGAIVYYEDDDMLCDEEQTLSDIKACIQELN